ncbi:ABC transporter substrate-binding protein [Nocardiopsis alba]|uniref:ABC transporter substrate-binding protein n=1 Tax=Nocardiopsis alba TaxID=53437 RepID=UPI00366F88A8
MADPAGWRGADRKRSLLLGTAAALVLAVVATTLLMWDRFTCGGPNNGVREIADECVGVTEGDYVFHDDFTRVQELIREENERVAALGDDLPVVRVALLGTFTFDPVSPMDPGRMLRSLEGAYTAQKRANDTHDFGDRTPRIQLVVANMGSRQHQWEPVVDDLVDMARDEERPLVAVTGMGVSIASARDIARTLDGQGIPMVSTALTADGLAHGPGGIDDAGDEENPTLPGVLRVAPSNTEYIKALRGHLDGLDERARTIIVYDRTEPDLFVASLKQAYTEHLDPYIDGRPVQEYEGTTVGDDPVRGLFAEVTMNVCVSGADTVLFAGRAPDLDEFMESLAASTCDRPMRIMFVATGLSVLNEEGRMAFLADNDLTLVYASGIDTRWNLVPQGSADAPEGYRAFREAYIEHFPSTEHDPEGLRNGYALVNHDAVAVAAQAIRMTNELGDADGPPTAHEVRARMMLLNTAHEVRAGGGTLGYSPEGAGEATGRFVPIVEMPLEPGDAPAPDPHVIGDE